MLRDTEIKFGVHTGRSYAMLKNYILTFFPDQSMHVTSGGGEVVTREGIVVWSRNIVSSAVRLIIDETEKLGSEYCFSQGDTFYGSRGIVTKYSNHPWKIRTNMQIDEANLAAVPLISIVDLNTQSKNFFKYLDGVTVKKMLGENNQPYLDITQGDVTKLIGSIAWAGLNGFGVEEVAAFGDAENDLEILGGVGLGIAMGNAIEEVKKVAKIVIKHTDEDGLAQFIEKLIKF